MLTTALAFCITLSCSDRATSDLTGLALNDSTGDASRVVSATVTLAQSSLEVGQATQATALLKNSRGRTLDLSVVWSSSSDAVATVSASGLVTAISPGAAAIIATRGSKSGSASLTVTPSTVAPSPVASITVALATSSLSVGQTTQAMDTTRDSSNNVLTGRVVKWSSANASIASVDSTSGMVMARTAGATQITASSEGVIGAAPLSVTTTTPVAVASVSVSPSSSSIQVGGSVQISAVTRDANNSILTGRVVTWSSGSTSIASVNSTGLVLGLVAGSTTIKATSEGVSGGSAITVTVPPPPTGNPSTVTDLRASAIDSTSVTLSFAQVNDGTGQPAKYDVRYAVAPISWGSATSTTSGTCKTPVAGTAIGSQLSCTVLGLTPATKYNLQLIAFRGTLNLNAVFGSLSNVVSATTTGSAPPPPPPPPPAGAWRANEPTGLTQLTSRPFNALNEDGWLISASSGSVSNFSIVSDSTAPRSPNNVGAIKFPAGFPAGGEPVVVYKATLQPTRVRYWCFWFKLSDPWQSQSAAGSKIMHLFVNGVNRVFLHARGFGSTDPVYPWIGLQQLASNYDAASQGGQGVGGSVWLTPNQPGQLGVQIVRGQWVLMEGLVDAGTAGGANGSVKWWINGALVGSYTGIPFVAAGGSATWEDWNWGPTWGGLGGTVAQTQYQYIDEIYISGRN
jgi:uncharacterized protein YjdB